MIAHGFCLKEQASVQLFELEKEIKDPENMLPSRFQWFLHTWPNWNWKTSAEEGRLYYFDVDKDTAAQQCGMLYRPEM